MRAYNKRWPDKRIFANLLILTIVNMPIRLILVAKDNSLLF